MAKDMINIYVTVRSLFSTTGQMKTTVFPRSVIKSMRVSISPMATSWRPTPGQLPPPFTKEEAALEKFKSQDSFLSVSIFPLLKSERVKRGGKNK